MDIVLVGPYPPPFGGISINIKNLKKYLSEKSIHCEVYSLSKEGDKYHPDIKHFISNKTLAVSLIRRKGGIIHLHLSGFNTYRRALAVTLACALTRKRLILTLHSGSFAKEFNEKNVMLRKIAKSIFNQSKKIICVNQTIQEQLIRLGIPGSKCSVIPAFSMNVDLKEHNLPNDLNEFIGKHSPLISCMGYTYEPHYGFDLAIKATIELRNMFPNIGLIIVGPQEKGKEFQKLADDTDLQSLNFIKLAGEVEYPSNLLIIRKSSLFLRPTYHDGDAVSIREAQALGVPVLASKTNYRPSDTYLFEIGDYNEMLDMLKQILGKNIQKTLSTYKVVDKETLVKIHAIYAML